MKQKLWILILLILLITVFGCTVALAADSGQLSDSISWTLSDTGVLTISGRGAIPDYGNGINESPFLDNDQISSVIIENAITAVGDRTFAGARNLTSVTFPGGLESIGYGAFARTGLTEVTIPASVTGVGAIGDIAFYGCANLSSVTIMNSTIPIYDETFSACSPTLVLTGWKGSPVEAYALENGFGFTALTSGSCGDRANWTFDAGSGLLTITGSGPTWDYHDYRISPFLDNPFITAVEIENRITKIGDRMFVGAENLTAVTFPGGLESIGYGAFARTGLTEVTIPASVTGEGAIGDIAFYGCPSLNRVTIMSPAVSIYDDTFSACSSALVLVGWKGSPVEEYALENSIFFESLDVFERMIVLPDDLTAIGCEAFVNIDALYVMIPASVTSIDGNPFAGSNVLFVYGWSGTAAETFAQAYGYKFLSLDGSTSP